MCNLKTSASSGSMYTCTHPQSNVTNNVMNDIVTAGHVVVMNLPQQCPCTPAEVRSCRFVRLHRSIFLNRRCRKYLPQSALGLYCSSDHTSLPNTICHSSRSTCLKEYPSRSPPTPLRNSKGSTSKPLLIVSQWLGSSPLCSPLLLNPTPPHSLGVFC